MYGTYGYSSTASTVTAALMRGAGFSRAARCTAPAARPRSVPLNTLSVLSSSSPTRGRSPAYTRRENCAGITSAPCTSPCRTASAASRSVSYDTGRTMSPLLSQRVQRLAHAPRRGAAVLVDDGDDEMRRPPAERVAEHEQLHQRHQQRHEQDHRRAHELAQLALDDGEDALAIHRPLPASGCDEAGAAAAAPPPIEWPA